MKYIRLKSIFIGAFFLIEYFILVGLSYAGSDKPSMSVQDFARITLNKEYPDNKKALKITLLTNTNNSISEQHGSRFHGSGFEGRVLQPNLNKRMAVRVSYINEMRHKQEITVWFKVEKIKNVAIANQHIPKNHVLNANDFYFKAMDLLKYNQGYLTGNLLGKVTTKKIIKGSPLLENDLIEKPEILQGDVVELIAKYKSVIIRNKAVAVENSNIDGFVRVKMDISEKAFTAKIIKPGVVLYVSL